MNRLVIRRIIYEGLTAITQTLPAVIGWLIGFPLTRILKRDYGLILVISRHGSRFTDNSKYFFIYATEMAHKSERVILLTSDTSTLSMINDAGGEVVFHPSWRSLCLLMRCGTVIIDHADWFYFGAYPLTRGAKLIQIWHGAPLKNIEIDTFKKRLDEMPGWLRRILRFQKAVIGRYPVYDVVVTTSQNFITHAFKHCFKAKKFIASGYPRNDILYGWPKPGSLAFQLSWINVEKYALKTVAEARATGQKVCLYMPTFRKGMPDPFETEIDLKRLSELAKRLNLFVVLKLHPFMHGRYAISQYPNLLEYEPLCDVYPLMPSCDLLITDYSSIFFDFLLLDRPILFFAYDLESYLNHDRSMYFDYDSIIPGAKCRDYDELEIQLEAIVLRGCKDEYAEMRMKIRSYTHDFMDNQSYRRLISRIKQN